MLLWMVIMCWHCIWTMLANATFELWFASATIYRTWFVITLFRTLMKELYLWTLCNMWHVCWIMYDHGCMWIVYRDSSWYSTDYRVYMGSSMTVRPLAGYHYSCALINWSVLRQLASEQDPTLIATCVFKTKVFVFQNHFLSTNSYINRSLKPRVEI